MKRVCLFGVHPAPRLPGFQIETFDPLRYFPSRSSWSFSDLLASGRNGYDHRRAIVKSAAGVDRLYRERNRHYMRMINDFVTRFADFHLIVMVAYNFIHPEILRRELAKPIKVLGLTDDPYSTYLCGIPYLWAFDGAFYTSPSYIDDLTFGEAIHRWTTKPTMWWPLVPHAFELPESADESFYRNRDIDVVYVGNPAGSKVERLTRLKSHFGNRIRIHGRWPLRGYYGLARGLLGSSIYPHRVSPLTPRERTELYWRAKIGFNMHLSDQRYETGNARMYEIPAHGAMMVCDKGAGDAHASVFAPNGEAAFYDSLSEAIEIIEHYISHPDERVEIARRGFQRFWRDYAAAPNLLKLLNWACSIRTDSAST